LGSLLAAGTVTIQSVVGHLDPADVLHTIEKERVETLLIVGDAFARPLCDEMDRATYDTSSLKIVVTGGAVTSPSMKERLLGHLPHVLILDAGGASETGTQLSSFSSKGQTASLGLFLPTETTSVIDADQQAWVAPGHAEPGWLAKRGAIPLGYLGDPAKTKATFPVVDGERLSVPGDRARLRADGMVELLGRESMTINSGGEKVFAEEVEQALIAHPDVDDALVVGRPSEKWGNEVVAVVQLHPGCAPTDEELLAAAAGHIARYKLPKQIVRVGKVRRSPSGKADYAWARAQAAGAS
jgi:fatty-acyl-CoA synthase